MAGTVVDGIKSRLAKHSVPGGTCTLWVGTASRGYGQMSVKQSDGTHKLMAVHRLAYMLDQGMCPVTTELRHDYDVSHLCHRKLCVNPVHLSFEPHGTNLQRRVCHQTNVCVGHEHFRNCVLLN